MGVFRSAASFRELQRPEFALRHFIRFLLAKVAVGSSLELITAIYKICGGVVSTVMGGIGASISTTATLPDKIVEAIEDVSFLESIPLWLVSLLGSLLITVLSFVLILILWCILSHALDLAFRLPVLSGLNHWSGALLGLVKGAVVVYAAAWLLKDSLLPPDLAEQTRLVRFFYAYIPMPLAP